MPDAHPDYPSHRQILAYMRSFADAYGFASTSTSVPGRRQSARRRLTVTTTDGATRHALVCAIGTNWHASCPTTWRFHRRDPLPNTYRSPAEFAGKRVLVIGANSGVDIARDAAISADRAASASAYHFIPSTVGIPSDEFAGPPHLPMWLEQRCAGDVALNGKLPLGYRPDHKLPTRTRYEHQLLHHLAW
jgi:cation diffusion facilitator CzcD-associated flavoprotein CzcO